MSRPLRTVIVSLFIASLAVAPGCAKKATVADSYFAAAMADRAPYQLPGVSGYTLRSYEIVQSTPDLVAVRLTFAGKLGNDIVQTKKFAVVNGQLRAVERTDIHEGIKANLRPFAQALDILLLKGTDIKDITYEKLLAEISPHTVKPIAKENYAELRVVKRPDGKIEMRMTDGEGHDVVLPFE